MTVCTDPPAQDICQFRHVRDTRVRRPEYRSSPVCLRRFLHKESASPYRRVWSNENAEKLTSILNAM